MSSLQGQPCLARTDSMPPGRVPNDSGRSISHLPPHAPIPPSHPSWIASINTRELVVAGRRVCVCVCECAWVLVLRFLWERNPWWVCCPFLDCVAFWTHNVVLSGRAAP